MTQRKNAGGRANSAPQPFGVSVGDPDGGSIEVRITGELDLQTSPLLEKAATSLMGRTQLVVLDLAEMSFIDSSGVRALIRMRNALAECDTDLRLRAVPPQVRRVLRVCGADVLFPELSKPRRRE